MFKRRASGYTIVEAMIFLAVSGIIFLAALLLFQGQQGKTQFDQSVRDLNSKIQQYVGDVNSGFFAGSNHYNCDLNGSGYPALSVPSSSSGGATGLGTNTKCIFMGKAIGAVANATSLQVYTVLGARVDTLGNPITQLGSAKLEPQNVAGTDLTETYNLLWGSKIVSSAITPIGGSSTTGDLVGFYNDLSGSTANGAEAVKSYGYPVPDLTSLKCSIEGTAVTPVPAAPCSYSELQTWDLCVQSGTSTRRALIKVNVTGFGVTTKLLFGGC